MLKLAGIIGMALAQLFKAGAQELEGLGDLGEEVVSVSIVFFGSRFESRKLSGPCRQGGTLQRARCHGGGVTNAEGCRLLVLLFEVLLGQAIEFRSIFLLDGASLAIELLYFV